MRRFHASVSADGAVAAEKPRWLRAIAGFAAAVTVMTIVAVAAVSLIDGRDMREGRSAAFPSGAASAKY